MAKTLTHVFLDTNVLDQAWPALSVKLENTLKAAQVLGIVAVVPEPVLVELRKHWRENIEASLKNAKDTLRKVGILIGDPNLVRAVPPSQALDGGYDTAVGNLLKAYGLEIGPMPSVAVKQLFHQANEQQMAFQKGGANFKDVVILHSVIEYLENGGGSGLFISDDDIFEKRKSSCLTHAADRKVALRIMKLSEAEEHVRNQLDSQQKERIERHRNLAKKGISTFLPAAQEAINKMLNERPMWGDTIGSRLDNAVLDTIIDVDVSVLDSEPAEGSEMQISAIVRGTVTQAVRRGISALDFSVSREPIEIGFVAVARFDGSAYNVRGLESFVYGGPFMRGTIAHPNWRGIQIIGDETETSS